MLENFSRKAVKIIDEAKKIAEEMNCQIVGTEHLLLALYDTPDGICSFLLNERLIMKEDLLKEINNLIILRKNNQTTIYTKELTDIVKAASSLVRELKAEYVYDEHLFYALLTASNNIAKDILIKLGVDIDEMLEDIEDIFNFNEEKDVHPFPYLTNMSVIKTPHNYISLGNYIDKIKIIMNKKQKNNPMLIGNAGVGKTAIVEGLVKHLPKEKIYRLDLGNMVSGTKYRGELEEKIINVMEYIKDHNAILFIDEIHNIVGAGSNEGSLDVANILKPYLARCDIRCIGATTLDEYYNFIDKDKALLRRFQNVFVDEPTQEETLFILENIKSSYEEYHGLIYSFQILEDIVSKSARYLVSRTFPDKAIDVLDELGARYKLEKTPVEELLDKVIFDMCGIHALKLEELNKVSLHYDFLRTNYERFIKDLEYKSSIATIKLKDDLEIDKLKDDLRKVLGFKEEGYLEIDLASYHEGSMLSSLIGTSKGYIGYDSGGVLSEHLIKYPLSLVYFKNLNQAHMIIQNFVKRLFTETFFIDNKSRKVYLSNTIIIYSESNNELAKIGF